MGAFASSIATTGAPAFQPPQEEGHSALGFLGNIIGGVKDVTLGLGKMIVAPAADIARGALEGLTLGKIDLPGGYMTDDVVKGLAAMPQDYWDRYSPLLPGGRPASQFLEEVYQKPVSFGLDALAVGSLAGKAAQAAGGAKIAGVGGEAAAVAEGVTDALLAQAKTGLRTAKAAGVRSGLEMLETQPLYAKLLPEVRQVRSGTSAVATTTLRNPLLRAGQSVLETKLGRHSLMEPIETFKANIAERAKQFEGTPVDQASFIAREEGIAARAEAAGVKYIDRAPIYMQRAKSTTGALQRFHSGAWFRDRLKETKAISDIVKPGLDQMDEKALTASALRSMNGHLLLEGTDLTSEIATRVIRESGGMVDEGGYAKQISLAGTPASDAMQIVYRGEMKGGTYGKAAGLERGTSPWGSATKFVSDDPFEAQRYAGMLEGGPSTGHVTRYDVNPNAHVLVEGTPEFQQVLDAAGITAPDNPSMWGPDQLNALATYVRKRNHIAGAASPEFTHAIKMLDQSGLGTAVLDNGFFSRGEIIGRTKLEVDARLRELEPTAPPVALRKDLLPDTLTAAQQVLPDYRPDEAIRIVQEHIDTTLKDSEGLAEMGWDPSKLAEELEGAERTKDWLVREAEKVASGDADPQTVMDARLRVKDIIDHESQFHILQDSPAMMLERAYRPMAEINGVDLPWQQLDDAVRAAGETAPSYFPMVDVNRVSRGDWTLRTPGSRASVKAAKDPHLKRNEQILLHRGTYMRDPLQARLIRAARHSKADGTLRYIEGVLNSRVGRVLEEGQHLAPDEVVIPLEALRGRNVFSKFFYDARLKHMAAGLNDADATLEAMKDLMDDIHAKIEAGELEPSAMKMYAVPKKVGDQLTATARAAGIINGPAAKVYFQGPMNAWRSLVLAGSPRWIVNNVLGNAVFSIMQGAPVARAFHLMEQRYKEILNEKYGWNLKHGYLDEARKTLDTKNLLKDDAYAPDVLGEVGTGYSQVESVAPNYIPGIEAVGGPGPKIVMNARSLRARSQGLNRAQRKAQLSRGERALSRGQKIGDAVRAFNGEVETAFRMNSALTSAERLAGIGHMKRMMGRFQSSEERMNRIMRDGITEASAKAIIKDMNFFLGDFGSLGPWERQLIRPYIFPFWGFYKHTAKLLLSYPFEYPERAVVLGGLASVTQDMMDKYGPMPSWMDAAMPLAPPGTGDQPFLMTSGPNPFSGMFQSPLGGLSPPIKMAIEHFTGRNLFTGQPFTDKDTITPFGTEQQFRIIRDESGKPVDVVEVDKVTPSLWEHMLSQVPQYELVKDTLAGGKTFDTTGIVDVFQGQGLIKDPETGEAKYPLGTLQAVMKFAGFSQMPFDYSSYQSWLGEQKQAALTEALNREGYGG